MKTSRIIGKIIDILFWVVVTVGAIAVIAAAALLIAGKAGILSESQQISLTLGDYKLVLAGAPTSWQWTVLCLLLLGKILILGSAFCYMLKVLQRIFRPMSQGKPFDLSISAALKKLAYAALFFGIARFALESIAQAVVYDAFEIPGLFSPERVASCSVSVVGDGSFIVVFAVLLLLSHVFRYGEELQRLSDETL